ncbi:IS21-like element helper ATPase IstB [Sorangium sp. So ce1335]|uniref:IS21-like element helper ATPase IstB n=1 Tax=Sorangium sp. So ce1335 TaxID=3133335 RepID=UPI003F5EEA38
MGLTDELVPVLKKLRLSGVLQSLEVRVRQAVDEQLSHEEFLVRLLSDEVDRRDGRQFDQRVRRAGFDSLKTLEDFDFQFNPRVPKAKVIDLATCSFVERRQNVLLVGQAGVGKSHIAQALGHRACRAGYQVLYVGAGDMLKQLRAGRADGSYDRRLARLVGVDLLVVDDLGLRSLTVEEAADVYEVIRLRYQRGAMILTSNRAVEEFGGLFGDPLLASAAMDRLLHDAHVLVLEGDSYRNPPPGRRRRAAEASKESKT